MIKVNFDGACEPVNPGGTAAYGVVIYNNEAGLDVEIYRTTRIFVPVKGQEKKTSNNVAEYSGFLHAMEWLIENGYKDEEVLFYGDSQLVIYQNSIDPRYGHKWEMRNGFYIPIARKAKKLLKKFPNLTLKWVPREENGLADELSKQALHDAGIKFRIQPEKI